MLVRYSAPQAKRFSSTSAFSLQIASLVSNLGDKTFAPPEKKRKLYQALLGFFDPAYGILPTGTADSTAFILSLWGNFHLCT